MIFPPLKLTYLGQEQYGNNKLSPLECSVLSMLKGCKAKTLSLANKFITFVVT